MLGWDRRLLRFRGDDVGRGFVRGTDPRTIYVLHRPIIGEIFYVGHDPKASLLNRP